MGVDGPASLALDREKKLSDLLTPRSWANWSNAIPGPASHVNFCHILHSLQTLFLCASKLWPVESDVSRSGKSKW